MYGNFMSNVMCHFIVKKSDVLCIEKVDFYSLMLHLEFI